MPVWEIILCLVKCSLFNSKIVVFQTKPLPLHILVGYLFVGIFANPIIFFPNVFCFVSRWGLLIVVLAFGWIFFFFLRFHFRCFKLFNEWKQPANEMGKKKVRSFVSWLEVGTEFTCIRTHSIPQREPI